MDAIISVKNDLVPSGSDSSNLSNHFNQQLGQQKPGLKNAHLNLERESSEHACMVLEERGACTETEYCSLILPFQET
jgi:hypothetical protein